MTLEENVYAKCGLVLAPANLICSSVLNIKAVFKI